MVRADPQRRTTMPRPITRRRFLRATTSGAVAATFLPAASWGRVPGANQRLRLGVIGTGGMGTHHTRSLMERRDADNLEVARVCDVYL